LRSVEGGKLYCVDTWKGSPNVAHHLRLADTADIFSIFLQNVKTAGGEDYVHPLKMMSSEASSVIENGSADLVFIDGDHSYSGAREDIALWKSKVREGGILCGHDCECRPHGSLRDTIYASLNVDHISGNGTPFSVIHPGVVVAVDEAFSGLANLWAESPFLREDGTVGRATLWDNRSPAKVLEQQLLPEAGLKDTPPHLVGALLGYNIVAFSGLHYAVPQSLGPLDLPQMDINSLPQGILSSCSYEEALRVIAHAELKLIREQQESASTELKLIREQQASASTELKSIKEQQELASTELKLIKEQQELASTELKLIKEQQELASAELKSITLLLVSVKGLAERIQRNPLVRIGRLIERIFTWNR
jgi:hypothetical protein